MRNATFFSILKNWLKLPNELVPESPYIYGKGIILSENAVEQA